MGEAEEQADGEEIEMKMLNPPLKMGNWLITMKMKEVIKNLQVLQLLAALKLHSSCKDLQCKDLLKF